MDLQQAFYESKFENAFLKAKGDAFQTFFEELMLRAYKGDFMACRPWGRQGDRKNDGFLRSEKRLFQVYAPNEMDAKKAIAKIREDFEGAKVHWKKHFDKWTFVHNANEGLPPHVQNLLLEYQETNSGIAIQTWSLEELRDVFRTLSDEDKQSWLGLVPTGETKAKLGFKDVQVVLENIAATAEPAPGQVKDVPQGKIMANALSPAIITLLQLGFSKTYLVESFFEQWYDPGFGERLACSFNDKYRELRAAFTPTNIFMNLQDWVGGKQRGTPEHQLAVITVLAYFFERCDIFEEPKGGVA